MDSKLPTSSSGSPEQASGGIVVTARLSNPSVDEETKKILNGPVVDFTNPLLFGSLPKDFVFEGHSLLYSPPHFTSEFAYLGKICDMETPQMPESSIKAFMDKWKALAKEPAWKPYKLPKLKPVKKPKLNRKRRNGVKMFLRQSKTGKTYSLHHPAMRDFLSTHNLYPTGIPGLNECENAIVQQITIGFDYDATSARAN